MPFVSVNPTTGETLETYASLSPEALDRALASASSAFAHWRRWSLSERAVVMTRAAELLEGEVPVVAEQMTREMGKTFAAAKGEVAKCAMTMRYYAEHAEELLSPRSIATLGRRSGVRYEPLGAILAIMPWNFPLWQAVRFAAPALMAGNVGLLKHAENVPGCALFLEDLFRRAGFPEGCFQSIFVEVPDVAGVIADPRVAAVTLTGSERAGRAVGALAGAALKPSVLELGGSDAFIVGEAADLDHTIPLAVTARVQNNGQSCIAAKRFLVVRSRAEEFTTRFADAMAAVVVGDPMDPPTIVGPLVSSAQRDLLSAQVADGLAQGAQRLVGVGSLEGPGFFYAPTVLTNVSRSSRAGSEELFGPVAVVESVDTLDDAIAVANGTPWGLGGSIWSEDESEIDKAIAGLEAGMAFANAIVASTPELPFGGIKASGYGRELADHGIHEFVNVKSFFVA